MVGSIAEWVLPLCLLTVALCSASTPIAADSESSILGTNETVPLTPDNSTGLFQLYKELKEVREWIKKPYVHGMILPAVVGVGAALLTVCSICCIHSCVRSQARRRRKRRIRNLADDLKTDRAMLLAEDSDDEI